MGTVTLNDKTFHATVDNISPVLVMFYADWAGPCHLVSDTFNTLSQQYGNETIFAIVNLDESTLIPYEYGVRHVPCFMLFVNGKPTQMKAGALPKEILEEMCLTGLNERS